MLSTVCSSPKLTSPHTKVLSDKAPSYEFFNSDLKMEPAEAEIAVLSPSDYEKAGTLFHRCTDCVKTILDIATSKVFPNLEHKNSFLDIGAGSGEVTKPLSLYFRNTSIVEPNAESRKHYSSSDYCIFPNFFQDCIFPQKFDFALCSHVLYHIDVKLWPSMIDKFIDSLNPQGKGMFVLAAARGKIHDFFSGFNANYPNSNGIISHLNSIDAKYEVIPVTSHCRTQNFDEAYTIFCAL